MVVPLLLAMCSERGHCTMRFTGVAQRVWCRAHIVICLCSAWRCHGHHCPTHQHGQARIPMPMLP
eukprot:15432759-Alexandrium_andersonii.AAC.1